MHPTGDVIRFSCSSCHAKFKVSADNAGKTTECPKCKETIRIHETQAVSEPQKSGLAYDNSRFACPNGHGQLATGFLRCGKCGWEPDGAGMPRFLVPGVMRVPQASQQASKTGVGTAVDSTAASPRQSHKKSMLAVVCTHCERRFRAESKWTGKRTTCPSCGREITIEDRSDDRNVEKKEHLDDSTLLDRFGFAIQVTLDNGTTATYAGKDGVKKLRADLIAGMLTRHNKAREVLPEPVKESFSHLEEPKGTEAFQKAHREWRNKASWRPIGRGLAKEIDPIRILYEPFKVCISSGGVYGSLLVFLGWSVKLVFDFFQRADFSGDVGRPQPNVVAPGVGDSLLGIPGLGEAGAVIALIVLGFLYAGLVGLVAGYPVGAICGAGYYGYRKQFRPFSRPPEDGFRSR